jgi:hypothetical protein
MRDVLGPDTTLGYCTNVHGGQSMRAIKQNLNRYAVTVKRLVSPSAPMGVGLWFSAKALCEFGEGGNVHGRAQRFAEWLHKRGLIPYTLNGFPYANFHQRVVKRAVYLPDWSDPARLHYTQGLALILACLLPQGGEGSISSLPIGWDEIVSNHWRAHLIRMVHFLADIHEKTGTLIHLDLEPEPGCHMGKTDDFFRLMLTVERTGKVAPDLVRRHVRMCYDICHAAVMFESADSVLRKCRETGFGIGKVQVSSALRAPFADKDARERRALRDQLRSFAEPRYLHQTTIGRGRRNRLKAFFEDLPAALAIEPSTRDEWRVHFHVPIFLRSIGKLSTTQDAIREFLAALRPSDGVKHFEVETYAWNVLPARSKPRNLANVIAKELKWLCRTARAIRRRK